MADEQTPAISRRDLIHASAAALTVAQTVMQANSPAEAQPAPGGDTAARVSTAAYIARRLQQLGCKTLFGVPGATCDPFFEAAEKSGMAIVVTASDLEAGYAADGYARQRGIGVVAVTSGVGTLSLINAIAGAYVERSPVVVVNGGPNGEDINRLRADGTLFSHGMAPVPGLQPGARPGDPPPNEAYSADLYMFRRVTAFAGRIEREADVARVVDTALRTALAEQRPVYIEVSKAMWDQRVAGPGAPLAAATAPEGREPALAAEATAKLRSAQRPVLLVGIEVQRYGLADQVTALIGKLRIPWATTLLAKSTIAEDTPGFAGVYEGPTSARTARTAVGNADVVLALGTVFSRSHREMIRDHGDRFTVAVDGRVRVGRTAPVAANLARFVAALQAQNWTPVAAHLTGRTLTGLSFEDRHGNLSTRPTPGSDPGLTYDEVARAVSGTLDRGFVMMTDTSLNQYSAGKFNVVGRQSFVANAIWSSIGYSVAAAVGVGIAEKDRAGGELRRPLVICGDGGFQMTAQALSTLARQNIRAIVLVLDNGLYAIEQKVVENTRAIEASSAASYFSGTSVAALPYLALARWDYVQLAKAMRIPLAERATTGAELQQALAAAKAASGPALISVLVKQRSLPSALV